MPTVKEIQEAVDLFYKWAHDKDFCKTAKLNKMGERALLPLLKTFFLGRFGKVDPEYGVDGGRIDFVVGRTAVEVVVRKPKSPKAVLSKAANFSELKKLLKYRRGTAVLVLLDFSKHPLSEQELEGFREWPSLGKGNHNLTAFNITYHYREGDKYHSSRKNIHVKKSAD